MAVIYLLLLVVIEATRIVVISAEECDVKYQRIGCFKDEQNNPRPLPNLLFSDREGPVGKIIDWKNWDTYIGKVICRCAKKTAKQKYTYFGMQFYGECWSGDGAATFAKDGRSPHCISKGFDKCEERSNQLCVGESHSNFVYMISTKDSRCSVKYKKVGCYHNNDGEPHSYPIMLFTDNNPESSKYSNISTGFTQWNSYVFDLACRCAARAKQREFPVFSLQNFGECWTGPRLASASKVESCIGEDIARGCGEKDSVCVGRDTTNFVFEIM